MTATRAALCRFPKCSNHALWRLAGVAVCAAHTSALERTIDRNNRTLDWPDFIRFRLVRRRGGYETWMAQGASSTNLTAYGHVPLLPLAKAQEAARAYAFSMGREFIDEERVLDRDTLRALFRAEVSP